MANTEKPTVTAKPTPRSNNVTPTIKQVIAFNLLSDALKQGKATALNIGDILRKAGYAEEVAQSPKLVTESKGFKSLLDKYVDDDKLAKKHDSMLEAATLAPFTFPLSLTDEEIKSIVQSMPNFRLITIKRSDKIVRAYVGVPDNTAQISTMKEINKVKGNYAPQKLDIESDQINEALGKLSELLPA